MNDKVYECLKGLLPREEKIIKMHFGLGEKKQTLKEIAKQFGVSTTRIRQVEAKAYRKLHPLLVKKGLRDFFYT